MARKMLYVPAPMQRIAFDPYSMPGVQARGGSSLPRGPVESRREEGEPAYDVTRSPIMETIDGMDAGELGALAQAIQDSARRGEAQFRKDTRWYREPFWYAVNIGAQGSQGVPIAAGVLSAQGQNRIRVESTSNFEAYFAMFNADDNAGLVLVDPAFRSKVFYAGSKGVTSDDENLDDFLERRNAWGTALRPARYVWPRVFPASSAVEIALQNDELGPRNYQLVYWGNKVFCGSNPRRIIAKPPFRREPFTFAMTFQGAAGAQVAAGATVPSNLQMLEHADFELLYITVASRGVAGPDADFELMLNEADGGPKSLMNIPIRRQPGFGTVERPTILTYPRYYARAARVLGVLTNRAANTAFFQVALHGNLII